LKTLGEQPLRLLRIDVVAAVVVAAWIEHASIVSLVVIVSLYTQIDRN
jgi:hypothetical protein